MTNIESRISLIETELRTIKKVIESTKAPISTDTKINQYFINKYYIKDFKDTLSLFQYKGNNYELFIKAYDPKIYKSNIDIIKQYITQTYSIPNPIIVTLIINGETYYDYIH